MENDKFSIIAGRMRDIDLVFADNPSVEASPIHTYVEKQSRLDYFIRYDLHAGLMADFFRIKEEELNKQGLLDLVFVAYAEVPIGKDWADDVNNKMVRMESMWRLIQIEREDYKHRITWSLDTKPQCLRQTHNLITLFFKKITLEDVAKGSPLLNT